VIAIDAGWRVYRERSVRDNSIRVMTIYDGHSAYEIALPFDLSNARERRAENANKPRIDLREAWAIKSRRDGWLEECKEGIRNLDVSDWPDDGSRGLDGLPRMSAGTQMRLRSIHGEWGINHAP